MPKAAKVRMSPKELATAVNKKFGEGTLVIASQAYGLVKPRISTGSFALGIMTGGGYPEGGIEIIEGDQGSSKSWNLHRRASNFLALHPKGVYILVNSEGTNDPPFLDMLGVDLSRTYIVSPNSGEESWDVIHYIAEHSEKVYVGVDSLDACVPLQELEGDMDEHKMAPAARMNNKGFRKLITLMRSDIETAEHRMSLGVICQIRESIGVMFGDTSTTVGGKGKLFAATTRTRYKRIKRLRVDSQKLVERVNFGLLIEVEVVKNKGIGEGEKTRFTLYKENFDGFKRGQIDNVTELIPFLLTYKIVDKAGAWYRIGKQKFQGDDSFAKYLRENDAFREELEEKVKEAVAHRHTIVSSKAKAAAPKQQKRRSLPKGK